MRELSELPAAQAAFARIRTDADRWRNDYAEPTIAAIRVGDVEPRSEDALAHGKELFDVVRSSFGALDSRLTHDRAAAQDRLDTATYQLSTVLGIFGLLVLLGGAGVWWIFRVRVQVPLTALGTDARRVAGGELSHQVRQTGPIEFAMLAADVESMRGRIVDELVSVSEARQSLEAQAQVLARSNAELEQFAYVASHDLQEPLRKVASFCQLLQSRYGGQLDEKADQYIEFAVDGAKRMQALINDLLAFSRAGRVRGPLVEVDCNSVVDEAVDNLADRIAGVGARINRGELPRVKGERALLTAVFQNLIGNAIKFARPGVAPEVDVTAERQDDGDDSMWLFTVRDNGIGIAPQHAERVFTIFQRLHAKDAYEGTGIGLALCRKIVEDLGGRIWVVEPDQPEQTDQPEQPDQPDEPLGFGTTICFTLPVATSAEDPTIDRPDPDTSSEVTT
jgi:signal transduction histidine kinase